MRLSLCSFLNPLPVFSSDAGAAPAAGIPALLITAHPDAVGCRVPAEDLDGRYGSELPEAHALAARVSLLRHAGADRQRAQRASASVARPQPPLRVAGAICR